jgi:hypothetical protein
MLCIDTFLTTLYFNVDEFCREKLGPEPSHPGPRPALSRSEAITLSIFGQWARFRSEKDFWRFAKQCLGHLFLRLPDQSQFNRSQCHHQESILAFSHHLVDVLGARSCAFEVLDRCGVATRWCGRRGSGWLSEYTDKGLCSRLGFFEGLHLLTCSNPEGVITGFAVGPASAKDQPLASAFFSSRHFSIPRTSCVGPASLSGVYITDKGFNGKDLHKTWLACFGVSVLYSDKGHKFYTRLWYRSLSGFRQIIETVHNCLVNVFRLENERPHSIQGFFSRLSAKVALHNFCIFLNRNLGRPSLQFADLLGWR